MHPPPGHDAPAAPLVSSLAVRTSTAAARASGADVEGPLRRAGIDADRVDDLSYRVTWDACVRLLEELAQVMGLEAFLASGERFVETVPDFVPLARTFVRPLGLMRFVYEVIDPAVFPVIAWTVEPLGDRRFALTLRLADGLRPSPLFWEYMSRTNRTVPTYFGLPLATIHTEHEGSLSRSIVEWPSAELPARLPESGAGSGAVVSLLQGLGLDVVRLLGTALEDRSELEEKSARLRGAVEEMVSGLPNAAYIVKPDERVVAANAAAARRLDGELGGQLSRAALSDEHAYRIVPLLADERLVIARELDAASSLASSLELLPMPLAVLDAQARVVAANRRLTELVAERKDLRLAGGRLRALRTQDDLAIREAAEQATNVTPHHDRAIPAAHVLATGAEALTLTFVPFGERASPSALVVFLRDEDHVRLDPALVSTLFGLTKTEARIAVNIAEGRTLDEIAAARGSSLHTVRAQLKAILAKTGARGQADLVRKLLSSAVVHLLRSRSSD